MMDPFASKNTRFFFHTLAIVLGGGLLLAGCRGDEVTGPTEEPMIAPVSISLTTSSGSDPASAGTQAASRARTVTDPAGNTIRLDEVKLVLREVQFTRSTDPANCSGTGDAECEEVESGPLLVSLPLSGSTPAVVVDTTLPTGTWAEVEFDVDPLDPARSADSVLIAENEVSAGVSVRVEGAFTPAGGSAQPFTFTCRTGLVAHK
mgnify:CR=1 FL=1